MLEMNYTSGSHTKLIFSSASFIFCLTNKLGLENFGEHVLFEEKQLINILSIKIYDREKVCV